MRVAGAGRALPEHYYSQQALLAELRRVWSGRVRNTARLERLHQSVRVGGRHLALPIEAYEKLESFGDANDAFIACALLLGERAIQDALSDAGLSPTDIDHLIFVSVTGIATPSIDARLVNRLGLRRDVKRTPIFGLGCVAGAVGLTRAADLVRAWPTQVAVLLSVELCSLTLQRGDFSVANLIASGLFGDGAAAVVVTGAEREEKGPEIVATRSVFFPNTEEVMGWRVGSEGFRVVLSGRVPEMARCLRPEIDAFLAEQGLTSGQITRFICHPGGPRVIEALEDALDLPRKGLRATWQHLEEVGNLSSASVLMLLGDVLAAGPAAGEHALLVAMGPGFCGELVLLRW